MPLEFPSSENDSCPEWHEDKAWQPYQNRIFGTENVGVSSKEPLNFMAFVVVTSIFQYSAFVASTLCHFAPLGGCSWSRPTIWAKSLQVSS